MEDPEQAAAIRSGTMAAEFVDAGLVSGGAAARFGIHVRTGCCYFYHP